MRERGLVERTAPGVVTFAGAPETWRQRLYVATQTGGAAGVVSHLSAAALHRIEGFREGPVHVTVPRGGKLRMADVVVHQVSVPLGGDDVVVIDGIRCTALARTVVDVASLVDARTAERAIDDVERRGASLDWLEDVATRLHRPGQRGTKLVLADLRRRRQRGRVRGSWFQKLIVECLASPALPEVVEEHEIRDGAGRFICRVDLAIPEVKLAIECHSRSFHAGTHAEVVDQRRENRAMVEGWQFLYFGWADRKTPREARRFLEQVVARRRADLGLLHAK
jgi:hypothetical protein